MVAVTRALSAVTVVGRALVAALTVTGRALVAELALYLRWSFRAVVLLAVVAAAWSWWLRPAVGAEIARQRTQVTADLRTAVAPHVDWRDLRDRITGGRP